MKKTKFSVRVLLCLLALLMALGSASLLASCTEEEKDDGKEEEKKEEVDVLAALPKTKFGGKFTIMCYDQGKEFWREDSQGDNVDYAIYMRNQKIKDTFGTEIAYKSAEYNLIPEQVSNIVKSNDLDSLDLINGHVVFSANIVLQGNALNWQEVPYVDLENDWWAGSNLKDLTLNDQTYIIIGDMNTSAIGMTYCMFYNKELADAQGLGDLYDLVMNKKGWTYDKMLEMIASVGETDLDKNGKYNSKDGYALLTVGNSPLNTYFWSFGGKIFTVDEETKDMTFTYYNDKIVSIFSKLFKLYYRTDGVYYKVGSDSPETECADMFVNDQGVFLNGYFALSERQLRQMDSEKWGIIPYPAWNASQIKTVGYKTMVDGSHSALLAPYFRSAPESKNEKIGVVTEALAALSHNGLRVEYYDKALKAKYIGDPKEAAMIDMLMASRVFDFGYIYLAFDSPAFWLQFCMPNRDANIASYYASKKNELNTAITKTFEAFGMEFEGLQ